MTDKELLRAYATAMYSYTVADVYSEAEKLADKKSTSLEDEILQRMAIPAAQPAPQPFFPIDTAPKDGTHILAADFTPGKVGFGGNPQQAYYCVVHWFQWCDGTHPEEAGWYPSTGAGDSNPMTNLTHWQPLQPLAAQPAPGWISLWSERPETDRWCWTIIGKHVQEVPARLNDDQDDNPVWEWMNEGDEAPFNVVTHWQYVALPAPPEPAQGKEKA